LAGIRPLVYAALVVAALYAGLPSHFFAPLASILEDLPGYFPATDPERYRR
jgi:hypothetical protein